MKFDYILISQSPYVFIATSAYLDPSASNSFYFPSPSSGQQHQKRAVSENWASEKGARLLSGFPLVNLRILNYAVVVHTFACSIHMPELSHYKIKINHNNSSNLCLVSPHPNFRADPVWDKEQIMKSLGKCRGSVAGVKLRKLGSSSQILPLALQDCPHYLLPRPPGFHNLHVAPSQKGLTAPQFLALNCNWAGRPEFVLCLTLVTLN